MPVTDEISASDPHLLIVDDDERIRGLLRRFLVRNGYLVSVARDAAQARRLLAGLDFDLIVLDVMMPGEDGISLTRDLRRSRATPILLLTARGETSDRINGLEAGADDYLAKPFEPRELLLRIAAILRRAPTPEPSAPKYLNLGDLRYDRERGDLSRGDEPVRLTATEGQILRALVDRPGAPVSRAELFAALGREEAEAGADRAIDVQITRLRRKLEPQPSDPRYLQTVRGAGYMICPD